MFHGEMGVCTWWAPTSCNWGEITPTSRFITPDTDLRTFIGVITPFITGSGICLHIFLPFLCLVL